MTWQTIGRKVSAVGGLLVLAAVLPAASLAQSAFPSGAGQRAGTGTYGTFDVGSGESHTIADLDESQTYRVCIVGKRGRLVVDNKEAVPLDNGDCHDSSGRMFRFTPDEGAGETQGYYRHVRRDR